MPLTCSEGSSGFLMAFHLFCLFSNINVGQSCWNVTRTIVPQRQCRTALVPCQFSEGKWFSFSMGWNAGRVRGRYEIYLFMSFVFEDFYDRRYYLEYNGECSYFVISYASEDLWSRYYLEFNGEWCWFLFS